MAAPSPVPGVLDGPPFDPGRIPVDVLSGGSGGAVGDYIEAPRVGIQIAFQSPALTDRPLWIRIDGEGS